MDHEDPGEPHDDPDESTSGGDSVGDDDPPDVPDETDQSSQQERAGAFDPQRMRDLQEQAAKLVSSPAFKALQEQQRRVMKMLEAPAWKSIYDQQWRFRELLERPGWKAIQEQQQRFLEMLETPAWKSIYDQHRFAKMLDAPAIKAMEAQQRRLAELTRGPAFESIGQTNLQIARLAESDAVKALVRQQGAWSSVAAPSSLDRLLTTSAFRDSYLARSDTFARAISKVEVDPGWTRVIRALQESPEVSRWARTVADALDTDDVKTPDLRAVTEALINSDAVRDVVEQATQSDTAALEDVVAASAFALNAAERKSPVNEDEGPISEADADAYRALVLLWGGGQIVLIAVMAAVISGQPLVFLATMAAIAQITGYSLKDLIQLIGGTEDD